MRKSSKADDYRRSLRLVAAMAATSMAVGASASPGRMSPDRLALLVVDFAAARGRIDPRLLLPDCAAPVLGWAVPGRTVAVDCPAPVWRINIPIDRPLAALPALPEQMPEKPMPLVRRGDHLRVESPGDGFVVGVEAVADADARDGRVMLRNLSSGARLMAQVGADGRIVLPGSTIVMNRR